MNLTVKPVESLRGAVQLPASKSYSIRAFMIAACGGTSRIIRPSDCDDAIVAMKTARALGSRVKTSSSRTVVSVTAQAHSPRLGKVDVGESGTVLRFLLPLVAMRTKSKAVITGGGTLTGRPNRHLADSLRALGFSVRGKGKVESIPLTVGPGDFEGGDVTIDGSLSSQFVSAFLIACPALSHDTRLTVHGSKPVSQTYVTMTRQILKESGIVIRKTGPRSFRIPGAQKFKGLKNFTVPSDYGLAGFLMAAAALVSSEVTLQGNLKTGLIQADGAVLKLMRGMGVVFRKTPSVIRVKGPSRLTGGAFSLRDCPDLLPVMAVLALFARRKTRLYNIGHARIKESDRISDLRKELLKVGAKILEKKDELTIIPQQRYKSGCVLNPHHDHRLAMAFAVLGMKIGVTVRDIECTAKSYPGFVRDLKSLCGPGAMK